MKPEFLLDHIHGDKFAEFADVEINQHASGEKVIRNYELINGTEPKIIFCKTDFVEKLFDSTRNAKTSHILITHNSDFPIDERRYEYRAKWVACWYALNVNHAGSGLVPIPSGMERPNGGGYSSDVDVLIDRWKEKRERQNIVYINHNVNNNPTERKAMTERLSSQRWCTWRPHGVSFHDYIQNVYEHDFVAAPIGNGIDCHRTWEALYMGTIPIVKRSLLSDYFIQMGLPILAVADWSIATEELLSICRSELLTFSSDWNLKMITMAYWKGRILEDMAVLKGDI